MVDNPLRLGSGQSQRSLPITGWGRGCAVQFGTDLEPGEESDARGPNTCIILLVGDGRDKERNQVDDHYKR